MGADGEDELLAPCQLGEALLRHRRRAVLLRLPRGEAQIILALLLVAHAAAMEDRQRDDLVVVLREPHAAHAGRVAALESADLVAGEADRLALPRREPDQIGRASCRERVCQYV